MMKIFNYIIFSLFFLTLSQVAVAVLDPNIKVSLEDPAPSEHKSGIGNTRGFATTPYASFPIVRIELYVDGVWQYNIPYGGPRPDVCSVFPNPNCENSGFGATTNYSALSAGSHTMTVRAVDSLGDHNDSTKTFTVERFHDPFVANSNAVDFLAAMVMLPRDLPGGSYLDKRIWLDNVYVAGQCYNIDLDWKRSIQAWGITNIYLIDALLCEISN